MGRTKGSGLAGSVRSARLPLAIDAWFEERLMRDATQSSSELMIRLVHGGLRLREGYMSVHRVALETRVGDASAYETYRTALFDTFGAAYVEHLEQWLLADGVAVPTPEKTSTT